MKEQAVLEKDERRAERKVEMKAELDGLLDDDLVKGQKDLMEYQWALSMDCMMALELELW
jgi:hypothetical protein